MKNEGAGAEDVIRGPRGERDSRYKLVECTKCKEIDRCTPDNDFYVVVGDEDSHLCEGCFVEVTNEKYHGVKIKVAHDSMLKEGDTIRTADDFRHSMVSLVDDPDEECCRINPTDLKKTKE